MIVFRSFYIYFRLCNIVLGITAVVFFYDQVNAGEEEKKISLKAIPVEVLVMIFRPLIHEAYPEQAPDSALISKFYNHIINSNIENLNFRMDGVDQKKLISFRKYLSKLESLKSLKFVVYAGGMLRAAVPNLRNNQGQNYINREENIALYLERALEVLVKIETFHFSLKHAHLHVSPIFLGLGMGLRGGGFVNLRVLQLNLESSNMDDEKVVIFASALRSLPSLKDVDLNFSNNAITVYGTSALGIAFSELLGLKRLRLNVSKNGLGYAEVMALVGDPDVEEALGIKSLVGLTSLDLDVMMSDSEDHNFVNQKIELQKILKKLPNLIDLRFAANQFIYKGLLSDRVQEFRYIALVGNPGLRDIAHFTSLHLGLSEDGLDYKTEHCVALAAGLQQMKRLTSLDLNLRGMGLLSPNNISMVPLAAVIVGLTHLIHLSINLLHSLDADGAIVLAGALGCLNSLHTLSLGVEHCRIKEAGLKGLAEGLGNLTGLKSLCLELFPNDDGNGERDGEPEIMYAAGGRALVQAIGKLQGLTYFSFDFFFEPQLSSEDMQSFLASLEGLPHLRKVRLAIKYCCPAREEYKFAFLLNRLICLSKVASLEIIFETCTACPPLGKQNDLSDITAIAISGLLKQLAQLSSVHISLPESKISDIGAIEIAKALKTLENLRGVRVNLSKSKISCQGAVEFYKLLKYPQWKYDCHL